MCWKTAKRIIDFDRLESTKEQGYTTLSFTMVPSSCTPQNEVLFGSFFGYQKSGMKDGVKWKSRSSTFWMNPIDIIFQTKISFIQNRQSTLPLFHPGKKVCVEYGWKSNSDHLVLCWSSTSDGSTWDGGSLRLNFICPSLKKTTPTASPHIIRVASPCLGGRLLEIGLSYGISSLPVY
jgi:hypothetical protein